jgi:hypothetical protein
MPTPWENECPVCGNIDTEKILRILEAREIDEQGKLLWQTQKQPEDGIPFVQRKYFAE